MNYDTVAGKGLIVSATDSFLAKSLISKLESVNVRPAFAHADIEEIKSYSQVMELVILFMSEELFEAPETLVYLKDTIQEKELGLIIIGVAEQYDIIKKTIPEQEVYEFFERPLNIEKLMRSVNN